MDHERPNDRLEAFCDGIFAIAITLLILDLKVPPHEAVHSSDDVWYGLTRLWPSAFALTLSFLVILISWMAHHNFLRSLGKSSPQFMAANGFFMLTVIVIPFPTAFMAEYLNTPYAQPAIVFYCLAQVLNSFGWIAITQSALKPTPLVKPHVGMASILRLRRNATQGLFVYLAIALIAWWLPYVGLTLDVITWVYWLYLAIAIRPEEKAV